MNNLSSIDKLKLERLLGMESGYVLDFSNTTFAEFIADSVGVHIYDEKYARASGSKAHRLRAFWNQESDELVSKLLSDLLETWKTEKLLDGKDIEDREQKLYDHCLAIASRLSGKPQAEELTEDGFLKKEFAEVSLESLKLDGAITGILEQRLDEISRSLNAKAPLATIFLAGSTLEGILLGIALNHPKKFNQSSASPKDDYGKVLPFHDWKLNSFIDAACEIGLLDLDVKKFSHSLRDFRNYIHPYQQMASGFNPDEHTAKICWQVLRAAIADLCKAV